MPHQSCIYCGRPAEKGPLCGAHYTRRRKGQDMNAPIRKQRRYGAPFWESVDRTDACWNWTGALNSDGYGSWGGPGADKAHRVAWRLANGEIPQGAHVLHRCDNRRCVNPDHLFLGSNADNVADKMAKNRHLRGEATHAARLTEDDVRAIRADSRDNATIGRQYGVTTTTIWQIKHRKRWQHVA